MDTAIPINKGVTFGSHDGEDPVPIKETSGDSQRRASKVLFKRTSKGVMGDRASGTDRHLVKEAHIRNVFFPWMRSYRAWWTLTVLGALFSNFFEPYHVAFQNEQGPFRGAGAAMEFLLVIIFTVDIFVNFNLAYYDENESIRFDRKDIAKSYFHRMFWVDLIGIFPFEVVALAIAGRLGKDDEGERTEQELYISLLRLLRLVRLHRMVPLSDMLQYNPRVSLLSFTLLRNFAVAFTVSHFSACGMYFLARLNGFDDDTWLGPVVNDLNGFERYTVSLYWSVTTFTTVGYGDWSPVNAAEQIWGMAFMMLNIIVQSWIIGSITLLIVKGDEKTGEYRDALQTLNQYTSLHDCLDAGFSKKLRSQLRLEFSNREVADEAILQHFPRAVRRKVLRRLYLPSLRKTSLMEGVRPQFIDAFLGACSVEVFSPGEEMVERGAVSTDLFLLVGGLAEITTKDYGSLAHSSSFLDSERDNLESEREIDDERQLEAGAFIGDIGFFTESPQVVSVSCLTVCKTLTMSRSTYKLIAEDHPGSVGRVLQNLLRKVESERILINLPKNMSLLRAGSTFYGKSGGTTYGAVDETETVNSVSRSEQAYTAVRDLVKMHMDKQKDDQTTRLLFSASRGDTATISLMCDQGFDPDNADYDNRTGLMVAAMRGNTEVVKLILEYGANPNLADVHGSSALYEAVKNGHEDTMNLLLRHDAELGMSEPLAASTLCQAVSDGDMLLLKRLLDAGISVNAADYDKRTAAHIAAAEGNLPALKILVAHGADLSLADRWSNTAYEEATRANVNDLLNYMKEHRSHEKEPDQE